MKLCVIPARGGSKRIPRKNIRKFCGKPMIAWSIEAALKADIFERIIVSTDDLEIKDIALSCGAEVPFLRPDYLSDDHTDTRMVVEHEINILLSEGSKIDDVCCLYATAPFVTAEDIRKGHTKLMDAEKECAVYAAVSFPFPIQRAVFIDNQGYASAVDKTSLRMRSQDLPEAYHDAGQFCWATADTWLKQLQILDIGKPLIIPRWRAQDIDTEEDWIRAELMHQAIYKRKN